MAATGLLWFVGSLIAFGQQPASPSDFTYCDSTTKI